MAFQPGSVNYTQGFGSRPETIEVPHVDVRAPTSSDVLYPIGKWWLYIGNSLWYLYSQSSSGGTLVSNWVQVASALSPNIYAVNGTANQITASSSAGVVTLSIPSTFIAPGSIAATSTVTAGTGLSASAGNLSLLAAGSGFVTTPTVTSGAASGAVICNGRIGAVTFTSPSIAGGASQTLTVTNSAIVSSSTIVLYSVVGATAGAALSIESVTNSLGSSAVVITNGTGATTQSANITLVFLVLN